MILSVFYTLVSDELKKGTLLDAEIPAKVREAVGAIQRNYTFKSMERFTTLTIDSSLEEPRAITQPTGFKAMKFFRIAKSDGTYKYLLEVEPEQITNIEAAEPSGYWQDGNDYFWLDSDIAEDYDGEMSYIEKIDWAAVETTSVIPFLTEFEELCLYATMVSFGPKLRDDKLTARYMRGKQVLFDEATREDTAKRTQNRDDRMIYGTGTRSG